MARSSTDGETPLRTVPTAITPVTPVRSRRRSGTGVWGLTTAQANPE